MQSNDQKQNDALLPERSWHIEVLLLSIVVLLVAWGLEVTPEGGLAVPGWADRPLPAVCPSRTLLGIECPACGLSRSVVRWTHGEPRAASRQHRLGIVAWCLIAAQVPYRLLALRWPERMAIPPALARVFLAALAVLFVGNWLLGFLSPL